MPQFEIEEENTGRFEQKKKGKGEILELLSNEEKNEMWRNILNNVEPYGLRMLVCFLM